MSSENTEQKSLQMAHEGISHGVKTIELITADKEEIARFQEKVSKLHGGISVFIHPFFADVASTNGTTDDRYVTEDYAPKRDKFLSAALKHDLPFIVFEPEDTFEQLGDTLAQYGSGNCYSVKTELGSHRTVGGQQSWDMLTEILRGGNIDHVILGGMFLMTYKSEVSRAFDTGSIMRTFVENMPDLADQYPLASRWIKKDLAPVGCAGHAAIHFLNSGIDVALSPVATPSSGTSYIPKVMVPYEEEF